MRRQEERYGKRLLQLREHPPKCVLGAPISDGDRTGYAQADPWWDTVSVENLVTGHGVLDLPFYNAVDIKVLLDMVICNIFIGLLDSLDLSFIWWYCTKMHRSNQFQFQILTQLEVPRVLIRGHQLPCKVVPVRPAWGNLGSSVKLKMKDLIVSFFSHLVLFSSKSWVARTPIRAVFK